MNWVDIILIIALASFGVFIAYQIGRMLFGGSWSPENVIIGLLIFSLGTTVAVLRKSDSNSHKLDSLQKSFGSLARDYKDHMNSYHYKKE